MALESRRAIIIGIDNYLAGKHNIPDLAGAENDAREIHEQFIRNGNFLVPPNHLLVGRDATRSKILKAVSEIFNRSQINSELVVFYFSGHGMIDENDEGYIVPYDMDPEDPFVNGINMENLRNFIYKSKNKASTVILLDCCYAGIATKGTKGPMTTTVTTDPTKNLYATQLKKMVQSGHGNVVLASSEPNAVSREKNNCVHLDKTEPHTHGAFSFHLIEGLDGKAADRNTGIITIESLRKHIENQMKLEQKQTPQYYVAEANDLDSIIIAKSLEKHIEYLRNTIQAASDDCARKYQNSNLVDIEFLASAAKKIGELRSIESSKEESNPDIWRVVEAINRAVQDYFDPTALWIVENGPIARRKINEIEDGLYDYKLQTMVNSLSFDSLQRIDQKEMDILIQLFSVVARNIKFKTENDIQLNIFHANLRASINRTIGAKGQSETT